MFGRTICYLILSACAVVVAAAQKPAREAIQGRWNITVHEGKSEYPSWLEIEERDGGLTGSFVGQHGSVRKVMDVRVAGDQVEFAIANEDGTPGNLLLTGRISGDRMIGTMSEEGRAANWSAVRAPVLTRSRPPRWGKPVALFNGKNLNGWKSYPADKESLWEVRDGVLFNAGSGAGLVSERKFSDFRLHLEFKIEPGSDSGVYLRGRYEIEIEDSYGKSPEKHLFGSIYGRLSPKTLPAKRAGEWQTIDATLVGRKVSVVLNGTTIIDEQEISGITGGALDSSEGAPGPFMLQGDYGPVSYRNIVVTPALEK